MKAAAADLSNFRITPSHQLNFSDLGSFPTQLNGLSRESLAPLLTKEMAHMEIAHEMLHASKSNGFLFVLQALDAAGKDSAVKHGLSGLNVVGTRAISFKAPTKEELKEEFLDRHTRVLPQKGEFGVWVRSHYEEVGVVRVHPEYLRERKGPSSPKGIDPKKATEKFWNERLDQIAQWERERVNESIPVVKVFLNASDKVRIERLIDRTEKKDKHWKVAVGDLAELNFTAQYRAVYQAAINATSTNDCPWYVVPADDKQEAHLLVARIINYELDRLNLQYPHFTGAALREINQMGDDLRERLKKLK